ncbi:MAG: outer membrane lipoprotein carrier protein LolA [Treponema sp.]
MKKYFSVVLFMSCVFMYAQETSFKSVCTKLAEHPNMTGNFTQVKTIKKINRNLNSSGTFIFSLDGIMWNTQKPFPSVLAVGMTSVIQTMPDGKQNVIDASSNRIFRSISGTLSSMFSGNAESLYSDFNIEFSSSGKTWNAVLTPKDSTVAAVLSSIAVSGESLSEVDKIIMTESGGDTITYNFTDKKYPKELTADEKAYFIAK